ncbi:hypothetical protein NIES4074_41750 [Cylindrospermum sp. NIES-4074]|nr:hypothetical protein NIES4074_41750 [Cylindrospermum sp. NIES-4074]
MDILIESTKTFEQDIERFSNQEKFNIIKRMNRYFELLSIDKNLFYKSSEQLINIKLNHNYESSIYSLKICPRLRVILTIDDDPIFGTTLITLFRVVNANDASKAYNAVAESLYQDFTIENREVEVSSR